VIGDAVCSRAYAANSAPASTGTFRSRGLRERIGEFTT
jgi:hypothetical protein